MQQQGSKPALRAQIIADSAPARGCQSDAKVSQPLSLSLSVALVAASALQSALFLLLKHRRRSRSPWQKVKGHNMSQVSTCASPAPPKHWIKHSEPVAKRTHIATTQVPQFLALGELHVQWEAGHRNSDTAGQYSPPAGLEATTLGAPALSVRYSKSGWLLGS